MPVGESYRPPQEPKAPGDGGGAFKKPGAEGAAPPRPGRILSPGRIAREGATRSVRSLRVGGGEVSRRVLSPNRMAEQGREGRSRVVSHDKGDQVADGNAGADTVSAQRMPSADSFPGGEAARDAWMDAEVAKAKAEGYEVLFRNGASSENTDGPTMSAAEMPSASNFPGGEAARDAYVQAKIAEAEAQGLMIAFEAGSGGENSDTTNETSHPRELDPVKDAAYIKGEKARNIAAKVIEKNQLGENPDPVTLSQYGEAVAPEIDSIQSYFDAKIEGNPERGIPAKDEKEVLAKVRDLVGDTSDLGLLDNQLNGTTEITRDNMGEALILAAAADPEGFKERMEAMDLKGADTYIAKTALDTGSAEGMYTLHEQYLLSIGDEEGAARSMNERFGAERLDMSPAAVAEREEQRRIAEEEDKRLTDEARKITKNILKNTGKDADADRPGHEDKVDKEGVQVKEALASLEHKLLEPVADATNNVDSRDRVSVDTAAGVDVLKQVYALVGSTHVDFGNGLEPITRDNMAEAILLTASNDRDGFEERSTTVGDGNADIAKIALGATSGEGMTSYTDDVAKSILNYGATKGINDGTVAGTIEQVVVPTLSGDKVVDVAVKDTDVIDNDAKPAGWDSNTQKAAYTKVFGEQRVDPLPEGIESTTDLGTPAISEGVTGGSIKVTGGNSEALPTNATVTGGSQSAEGNEQTNGSTDTSGDAPTFIDAKNPDATPTMTTGDGASSSVDVPTFIDAKNPDTVPTIADHPDVTGAGSDNGTATPQGNSIRTPDGDEIIMPGADKGGEFIDGRRDPVESTTQGSNGPESSETNYFTDGNVTVLYNPDTGEGSITIGDTVYTHPYRPESQNNGEQRGDMQQGLTNDGDLGRGDSDFSDSSFVIDASPVGNEGIRGGNEGYTPAQNTQSEVLAAPVAGDVLMGANDAGRAAAEELRAEEGDFLASTVDGAGAGTAFIEGYSGPGIVEAAISEKGGDEQAQGDSAMNQGGNNDDAVAAVVE